MMMMTMMMGMVTMTMIMVMMTMVMMTYFQRTLQPCSYLTDSQCLTEMVRAVISQNLDFACLVLKACLVFSVKEWQRLMLKEDKNFIFDSLQNDLNNGPPASTGEDQETGVVRSVFLFSSKNCNCPNRNF